MTCHNLNKGDPADVNDCSMATRCCQPFLDGCCAKDTGTEQLSNRGGQQSAVSMWCAVKVSELQTMCNCQLLLLLLLHVVAVRPRIAMARTNQHSNHKPGTLHAAYPLLNSYCRDVAHLMTSAARAKHGDTVCDSRCRSCFACCRLPWLAQHNSTVCTRMRLH